MARAKAEGLKPGSPSDEAARTLLRTAAAVLATIAVKCGQSTPGGHVATKKWFGLAALAAVVVAFVKKVSGRGAREESPTE